MTPFRFSNTGTDLRGWVDSKLQLGLLAIVHRQAFQEQRSEARPSATTKGVKHQEALQTCALVSQFANAVKNQVDNLLANGVVATSVVVGSIFFAGDQLLWVEQLSVCASTNLI